MWLLLCCVVFCLHLKYCVYFFVSQFNLPSSVNFCFLLILCLCPSFVTSCYILGLLCLLCFVFTFISSLSHYLNSVHLCITSISCPHFSLLSSCVMSVLAQCVFPVMLLYIPVWALLFGIWTFPPVWIKVHLLFIVLSAFGSLSYKLMIKCPSALYFYRLWLSHWQMR